MTQEEKAKAYDKAREKIAVRFGTNVAEEIFSEFEESEDEKIRKEIIQSIKGNMVVLHKAKCIAWLEKQGEQKQHDIDILEKHITKDSISELAHTVIVRNGWEIVDAKEQNPAWSEEDENYLNTTIAYLKDANEFKKTAEKCITWLKSLRPQNTWKPSDEQMKQLGWIAEQNKDNMIGKSLVTLYNDLAKLREG